MACRGISNIFSSIEYKPSFEADVAIFKASAHEFYDMDNITQLHIIDSFDSLQSESIQKAA